MQLNDVKETIITTCPLCRGPLVKKWEYDCYPVPTYNPKFSPLKVWMECKACRHLVSLGYPTNLLEALTDETSTQYDRPNHLLCMQVYGDILSKIRSRGASATTLLDVGCGAGELSLVARDFDFDVTAIDVMPKYVDHLRQHGIKAHVSMLDEDFVNGGGRFDVVCLGDVIEHVVDPYALLANAYRVLTDDGLLWVSTPDYSSSVASILGHQDAMRRISEHIHYFSKHSLYFALAMKGFTVIDFALSKHYIGSIEVIAKKGVSVGRYMVDGSGSFEIGGRRV